MSDWLRYLLIAILLLMAVIVVAYGRGRKSGAARTRDDVVEAEDVTRRRRRMAASVLGWLVLAMVVVSTAAVGLLWFLGWPRFPKAGSFDVPQMLDLLKVALSVVAGFGGVVLLAVNYRRQRVAEDEHDLDVDRAQREVEQRFNERLSSPPNSSRTKVPRSGSPASTRWPGWLTTGRTSARSASTSCAATSGWAATRTNPARPRSGTPCCAPSATGSWRPRNPPGGPSTSTSPASSSTTRTSPG